MTSNGWSQVLRISVLVLFLGLFVTLLVQGVMADQDKKGFGRLMLNQGKDTGVRVLLMNRMPPDGAIHTHDKATIEILQPVEVQAPDNPDLKPEQLKAGAILTVEMQGIDGFSLSSKDWVSGSRVLPWPVQSLWLVPRDTDPVIQHLDDDGKPKFTDPRTFEAANHRAVFRMVGINPERKPSYRGSLQILWRSPKEMALINHLPMECYLEGVVASEMSPAYPLEALKAQAIASRGFAFCRATWAGKRADSYDLVDNRSDQEYSGAGLSTTGVVQAVFETRGIIPTFNKKPFLPLFCASSGGYTESVDNIFPGMRDLYSLESVSPVMSAVRDDACERGVKTMSKQSTAWTNTVELNPREDIQRPLSIWLAKSNPQMQIGFITGLKVGRRDAASGRVQSILVSHLQSDTPIEIPAAVFRDLIGAERIRSTLWTPDSPAKIEAGHNQFKWRITTIGWGHGVGMSQISAAQLASEGVSAREILKRFYIGSDLGTVW